MGLKTFVFQEAPSNRLRLGGEFHSSWSKAIQVLSRSTDDTALQLDGQGGVKETPVEIGRVVLTDELVVSLAQMGRAVRKVFHGIDQDIEWATTNGKIVVLQSRPFVQNQPVAVAR